MINHTKGRTSSKHPLFADPKLFLVLSLHISHWVSDCLQSRSQNAEPRTRLSMSRAERLTTTGSRQAVVMLQPLCIPGAANQAWNVTAAPWETYIHITEVILAQSWHCRTFKKQSASQSCHECIQWDLQYPTRQSARRGSPKPSSGNKLLTVRLVFLHSAFSTKPLQQVWFWWGGKWWAAISREQSHWLSVTGFGNRTTKKSHNNCHFLQPCWFFCGGAISEPAELVQKFYICNM